jgi:hypothetical protein
MSIGSLIGGAIGGAVGYSGQGAGKPNASSLKTGQEMTVGDNFIMGPKYGGAGAAGAGAVAQEPTTTGLTVNDIFQTLDSPGGRTVRSGVGTGVQQTMQQDAALDTLLSQGKSTGQAQANQIQQQRKEFESQGMFGTRLPDNDYYDPFEDEGTAQQGVF